MAALFPGVEPERLHQRIKFLQSRAQAHLDTPSEDILHRACAGTLLRDAACVALMIGATEEARNLLLQSGHLFLQLGLTTGSTYIALAQTKTAREQLSPYQDLIEGVSRQWDRQQARERATPGGPMAEMSRNAPRQMFSLVQAEWLISETPQPTLFVDGFAMRRALERNGGHPVGTTGLSTATYSNMAEWMARQRESKEAHTPEFVARGFATIAATRAENIRAAMKDSYHWQLLARPAELLDLDAVVLSSIALGSGMDRGAIEQIFSDDVPLERAPIEAAALLRNDHADGAVLV